MPATRLHIRKASPADLEAIWRLHVSSVRSLAADHYAPEQIEAWVGNMGPALYRPVVQRGRIWVVLLRTPSAAEKGGELVAFGQLSPDHGELEALYVTPERAGRGVGRRLLRHLESRARGAGRVQLHLSASQNAVAFYRRQGYRPVGVTEHSLPYGGRLRCTDMLRGLPTAPALRDDAPEALTPDDDDPPAPGRGAAGETR